VTLPLAHGIAERADLPIPLLLFVWGAAVVLLFSFVGLAVLWREPRLERARWRPLPLGLGRVPASRPVQAACGAVGVALLALVVYTGLDGQQTAASNFAPTFVYVVFWVGLVAASVLFGDVFRAFNPWRAIGRAVAFAARLGTRGDLPPPLSYPERLGRWPAVLGLLAFTALELVNSSPDKPSTVAIATLAYSVATFVAMALYGVETWIERGEGFSVYFNLFARLSPFETRDGELGMRPPLSGLTSVEPLPGTVALVAVMIGTVTFDGLSESPLWVSVGGALGDLFGSLGLSPENAFELANAVGLVAAVALILGFYRLGIAGMRSVGGKLDEGRLAAAFAPSLIPIALAYVAAHYMTLLFFQGQAMAYLASDPLGTGANLLGTADVAISYFMGATLIALLQVGLVVAGHVAGLTLAHDRALVVYPEDRRLAVRSQYWMLAVMVGFTTLALLLLLQGNA
jgi:hypothetical protein